MNAIPCPMTSGYARPCGRRPGHLYGHRHAARTPRALAPFVAATHRVEQTREVVAAMLADPANPVFTLRVGDTFAGLIGFKSADSTTLTIEIGYWLRPNTRDGDS